jgi:hypothetical protein
MQPPITMPETATSVRRSRCSIGSPTTMPIARTAPPPQAITTAR